MNPWKIKNVGTRRRYIGDVRAYFPSNTWHIIIDSVVIRLNCELFLSPTSAVSQRRRRWAQQYSGENKKSTRHPILYVTTITNGNFNIKSKYALLWPFICAFFVFSDLQDKTRMFSCNIDHFCYFSIFFSIFFRIFWFTGGFPDFLWIFSFSLFSWMYISMTWIVLSLTISYVAMECPKLLSITIFSYKLQYFSARCAFYISLFDWHTHTHTHTAKKVESDNLLDPSLSTQNQSNCNGHLLDHCRRYAWLICWSNTLCPSGLTIKIVTKY